MSQGQGRLIHLSVLAKREKAAKAWEDYSKEIEAGTRPHLWDMLEERGYIKDIAGYALPPLLCLHPSNMIHL